MLPWQPGDHSHILAEEEQLLSLVEEEKSGHESFTAVVINGINATHIPYLKVGYREWTRQLAWVNTFLKT